MSRGRAWVAVDSSDRPVAYLLSAVLDGCAHIEQVSVAPEYARRGLGARLIDRLEVDAAASHQPALTLTMFRDAVERAVLRAPGFVVLAVSEEGPELRAITQREYSSIPGDTVRVAMRRPV